jgi:eukaryotic-like serine/threonine-protein kinase
MAALARVESELGDYDAARASLERARTIFEASLGPDSLEVGRVHHDLGAIDLKEERFEDARDHFVQALENYRNTAGSRHPALVIALLGLVQCCLKLEDIEGAEKAAEEIDRIQAEKG